MDGVSGAIAGEGVFDDLAFALGKRTLLQVWVALAAVLNVGLNVWLIPERRTRR